MFIRLFLIEDKYKNNTLRETKKESVSQQAIISWIMDFKKLYNRIN